jgi:predicted permease
MKVKAAVSMIAFAMSTEGFSTSLYAARTRPVQSVQLTKKPPSQVALSASALPFGLDKTVAFAALGATAKLLSSVGLGSLAALKPNLLDPAAVSALSRLIYWIFQPCFLMCSVASTLAAASSGAVVGLPKSVLLLMPLAAFIQISLGSLIAKIVSGVLKFPDEEARDFTMCTTFGNSGPLPLIFADALFGGTLKTDVTACISFYLLMWSPLFWSAGRMILGTNNKAGDASLRGLSKVKSEIQKLMNPPVVGSIFGVIIGGTGWLRNSCLQPTGLAAPLYGACNTLGTAYLPAAVLVLAGSLINNSVKAVTTITNGATETAKSGFSKRAVVSIMFSRFVLAPISALATVKAMDYLGVLSSGRAKAVVTFCLLMEGAMPPAQNSVIMYQLDGLPERAGKMAKVLALIYSMAVVPVTLLLSASLAVSGIMQYR